jgi:hypothetical protein
MPSGAAVTVYEGKRGRTFKGQGRTPRAARRLEQRLSGKLRHRVRRSSDHQPRTAAG